MEFFSFFVGVLSFSPPLGGRSRSTPPPPPGCLEEKKKKTVSPPYQVQLVPAAPLLPLCPAAAVDATATAVALLLLPPAAARPLAPGPLPVPPLALEALGVPPRDPDVRLVPPGAAVVGDPDHLPAEGDRGGLARDWFWFLVFGGKREERERDGREREEERVFVLINAASLDVSFSRSFSFSLPLNQKETYLSAPPASSLSSWRPRAWGPASLLPWPLSLPPRLSSRSRHSPPFSAGKLLAAPPQQLGLCLRPLPRAPSRPQ